jgi:hypothetical protein
MSWAVPPIHEWLASVMILSALSLAAHRGLRNWRVHRRAAWERERAEWRRWITRPELRHTVPNPE